MQSIFDTIFQAAAGLLSLPLLFAFMFAGFGIMSGQKPERAITGALRWSLKLVEGMFRLAFRILRHRGSRHGRTDSSRDNATRKPGRPRQPSPQPGTHNQQPRQPGARKPRMRNHRTNGGPKDPGP